MAGGPPTHATGPERRSDADGTGLRVRGPVGLRVLKGLELGQDLVILVTIAALYAVMARHLIGMWRHVEAGLDVRAILTDVLFLLILVEIFRLLMYYLRERHVAVGTMVEIGIISVLREIILIGPLEVPWPKLLAITVLLVALGALLRFGRLQRGRPLPRGRPGRSLRRERRLPWTGDPRSEEERVRRR